MAKFLTAKTTQKPIELAISYPGSVPAQGCSYSVLGDWAVPNSYPYWINFTCG